MHEATSRWDVCGSAGCFVQVCFKLCLPLAAHLLVELQSPEVCTARERVSWLGCTIWTYFMLLTPKSHSKAVRWALSGPCQNMLRLSNPQLLCRWGLFGYPLQAYPTVLAQDEVGGMRCGVMVGLLQRTRMKRMKGYERGKIGWGAEGSTEYIWIIILMQSKSMQDARHRKLSLQCWQWLKQHSCLASVAFAYVFIFLRSLGTKLPTTVNVVKSQCTCCRLSPVSDTESSLGESATLSLGSSKPVANVRISSYCHDINIRSPPFLRNHFNTLAWYSLV